jgi:Cd2+/Zn2+-exporting ATPase
VCEVHAESTFKVEGMDCREEVALLERRFKHLKGLEAFSADVMSGRLHVKYDAARVSADAISAAVADTGMRAWLEHEEPVATGERNGRGRLLLAVSGSMLAIGLLAEWRLGAGTALPLASLALSLAAGVPLTIGKAWRAARMRSLDINVLMLVAALGAIMLGQWSEAAAVVFLFAVAQALEARTLERARLAVRALMELTPTEALVRTGAGDERRPVDAIAPGEVIVIKPGEKLPLDGEVVQGTSEVNQAPITGESLPVDKGPGDEVFAGSINGRGALDVRVTRLRRDTTLARIIYLVEQAQSERAPSQTLVERFARVYTPAVLVLASLLAFAPPLFWGGDWGVWIYRALVLLVVSCPCALVISTPVSVVAALAGAARKGVLIKGGAHLERAGRVRCIAFDKTGTLTRGMPEVVEVVPFNGASRASVLAAASAIELRSAHPVARAIVHCAADAGVRPTAGTDVVAIGGRGAEGLVDGAVILLGNHRLFEERRLCTPDAHVVLDRLALDGRTPVLVAADNLLVGVIAVSDQARPAIRDTIDLLRRQGIDAVVMLTGDGQATARRMAADLGFDEVRADLLPEDKVTAIKSLRSRHGSVAMVGDGVNDAPALASADVGIVMGAAGSAAALETADVALMADDLLKIPFAIRLSRATVRNIRWNLGISLGLKAGFVVAAVFGVATLWMAVLADTGASILVVANALRLLKAD